MKYSAALLVFLAALVSYGAGPATDRAVENLRREQVALPAGAPDRSRMVITDYAMVWEHDVPLLIMVSYDDLSTRPQVDYTEIYDLYGNLIVIAWIDRYGIYQVAIDEMLLVEEEATEGDVSTAKRLVLVTGGTPV